jgi:hypothetical protein
MFTASVSSNVPALVRTLRKVRALDRRLAVPHVRKDLGMGLNYRAFDIKGRVVYIGGMSAATRVLDQKGRMLYQDIKSIRAAIAAQREAAPVDA